MILRKPVVDAVNVAAISADVGDELFCPTYCAALQDGLLLGGLSLLKSCLQEAICDGYGSRRGWVTHGLEPFPLLGFRKGRVPRARALPFGRQGLLAGPLPSPLSSFFSYLRCFIIRLWTGLGA